jgi:hypothetical protein
MNNNINQALQYVFNARNQGIAPQQFVQTLMQNNPYYQQNLSRLQNMAKGRTPQEFLSQLAKQQGLDDNSINMITQFLGHK